jgi:hypothetical protein
VSVVASTETSTRAEVGDEWLIGVYALGDDDTLVAATVVVTVHPPTGDPLTPEVVTEQAGSYLARVTLDEAGTWLAAAVASDGAIGVVPFTVAAAAVPTASARPTVAEVTTYLGETSASAAQILDAYTAEVAAQANACRIPPDYPADLGQGLKRRVARNLAARGVVLASWSSFDGGGVATRVPMVDAEIRRFEGPYRRRRVR